MESYEYNDTYKISELERKPELAFAEIPEADLSEHHAYDIILIRSGIGYGNDHYGRYKTVNEEKVVVTLYDNKREKLERMEGLADMKDDRTEVETITGGKLKRW